MKVLIVDDDFNIINMIKGMIPWENLGIDGVLEAENGKQALDVVKEQAPDIIISDIEMPVMDGLEATRRIRALDRPDVRAVPIIALTANAYESDIKSSLEAGMNEHLAKPADADMLYGTLRRHITQRHKAEAERKDAQ